MKILVINSGSSSIKYQLIEMPTQKVICVGLIERIGLEKSVVHYKSEENKSKEVLEIRNHKEGLQKVVNLLLDEKIGVLTDTNQINVVAHRVVHGGDSFKKTAIATSEVKKKIEDLFSLAPLHNPANLEGIKVAETIFKEAIQVASFDTAFHQTIPIKAYKFAIPNKFLTENKIRLYGFHGTSHKYVSEKAIEYLHENNYLQQDKSKIITIHLGNGCSITAIENGISIDHSLGFSPVTGLIMGSRSGDIDHSLIFYLIHNLGYDAKHVSDMLQKESGMLGLTGLSDLRDIEEAAEKGDKNCQLALDMNAYRIKKYIGSYIAVMNGVDAIVFTAGIGENSVIIRKLACTDLEYFGIELDEQKNDVKARKLTEIHKETSKVKILVIPTNEELEIAKQSYDLLQ
ncbi:acetate/propionate family kinase [Tenacibaculum piscium]|uniref:Acetate kinase n=1 Tax=Tenacibaculum piscium TaxID=1458515 RepID=A0A2H1YFW6_9FLAO|nr:acetate kinase [Tenacibaculum piscium]MBE7629157.1 acetate/propionate family kinase [Tenacibaculum piscium]MBE7670600.1 acetate/propionate family kinase [Tenacibaculum piscium]MBE7684820.1 acetate/propionate family kinase [Tenacibaculum piscium]SOS74320.1 Acetate kinase [Tenacibaculum piscium]